MTDAADPATAAGALPAPGPMRKPWWQSRTLWFNAFCAAAAASEASYGLLQPVLPLPAYALLAFILPVGNALLRVLTTQGLGRGAAP